MNPPSVPGAFLQILEFRTDRPEQFPAVLQRWLDAIGDARTTRWYLTAADRDRPATYWQIVEFPSRDAARTNSEHPATAEFAAALDALCGGELTFHDLDVQAGADLTADTVLSRKT